MIYPPPKFYLLLGGRRTVKQKETDFRFPSETLTLSKTCTMNLFSEISIPYNASSMHVRRLFQKGSMIHAPNVLLSPLSR